jgi:predicted TIM-barrel fold metal-dependent hydrolase
MSDRPFVDSHAHIFQKVMPTLSKPRHPLEYDFTAEDYLAILDKHGVHFAVLAAASNYGDYNDYVLSCLERYPRLRATVIVKPEVELGVLRDMKRLGVVGIRLMFMGRAELPDLTTFEYQRLFRRLLDLDMHVHLHLEGSRSTPIVNLLEKTGVKLVIDHFGTPDPAKKIQCEGFQNILRSVQRGRTWVKLSAGFRRDPAAAKAYATELIRSAGPERLVWGSDCPFAAFEGKVIYQDTIAHFNDWVPDMGMRHVIGCETPLKLYFS